MDGTPPLVAATYVVSAEAPIDLAATLSALGLGRHDPTVVRRHDGLWRATTTPHGPAVEHLRQDGLGIHLRAFGPGRGWLAEHFEERIGAAAIPTLTSPHPLLSAMVHRNPGLRTPRTRAVFEALVPTVLVQKVTGLEARRSLAALMQAHGVAAPNVPGAPPLLLPLSPDTVARLAPHHFHACGVDRSRATTIHNAATHAAFLDGLNDLGAEEARTRLALLPGIGPWSAAKVGAVAFGDSDAVAVGDYHLKNLVAVNLAGRARGTDEEMLALLEPYHPHRGWVVRLLERHGTQAPRYGPRMRLQRQW